MAQSINKSQETHKCPMCAEVIPVISNQCEYCGARFTITSSGYCESCHEVREADESGRCKVCGNPVMDWQFSTTLMETTPQVEKLAYPEISSTSQAEANEMLVLPIKGEGVNLRSSGIFLDAIIISLLYMVVLLIIVVTTRGLGELTSLEFDVIWSNMDELVALVLIPIVWFSYFILLEGVFGRTLGKSLYHLRVIKKGGGPINFGQAAIRALIGLFEINPIGAIVIWLTPLNQRIGDLLANTMVVNKDKVHTVEFNPPAISLEFHDHSRVAFAQITSGVIHKFGMIRSLRLNGTPLQGSPNQVKIRGQFFRAEFNMLCRNIESRYNIRFLERIMIGRLIMVILIVAIMLASVFLTIDLLSKNIPSRTLPEFISTSTPREQAILQPTATIQATPTILLSATPRSTQTPTPTPLPVEVSFDTIGDYPEKYPVILTGRLTMFGSTYCNATCGLLLENPDNPTQKITIFVPVGDGNNQMKPLPDSYTQSDIQVRLDDGTLAVIGYRVRVTGRVCKTTEGEPCISEISKMELFQVK